MVNTLARYRTQELIEIVGTKETIHEWLGGYRIIKENQGETNKDGGRAELECESREKSREKMGEPGGRV